VTLPLLADIDGLTTTVGVPLSIAVVALLVATDVQDWRDKRPVWWQSGLVVLVLIGWTGLLFYRFAGMA
jgi:hypothetical protein